MSFRYPNGKSYMPKNQKKSNKGFNKLSYSNRGMTLEEDLNITNEYYLDRNLAVIHKKPTPVQIVNVDYPVRSAAVIKEAYFKQASTTDYNGIFKGKYIDFEAKETRNKTSFPLRNFHEHQIKHMKAIHEQGGISFVILRFSLWDHYYLLDCQYLFDYWDNSIGEGRKSIPKKEIEECGHEITLGYHPRIDYLKIVDKIYFSSSS